MLLYLIKVTITWCLLLVLFEFFYKKNAYYRTNRFYLLFSLMAGMLIPMLPVPGIISVQTGAAIAGMLPDMATVPVQQAQPSQISQAPSATFRYDLAFLWLYVAGAAVMLFVSLKEVVLILRKAIYGHYQTIQGHKVFRTGREHAPFSFMGWIFISRPDQYSAEEMNFILEHEDAHNRQKHWLDIILMQLITIAFWFHPLVWRARHLLKLTHEYEADALAAGGNAHDYGHFLIQQTLLKGTPSIAHSFHYSPLKNRITMLTKNRKKNTGWTYAAILPVLCCSMLFMAMSPKESRKINRLRVNNITETGGNIIKWSEKKYTFYDTSAKITDPETKETKFVIRKGFQMPVALEFNGEKIKPIFIFDPQTNKKQREYPGRRQFSDFITSRFMASLQKKPQGLNYIIISDAIIDKEGTIQYYEITYGTEVSNPPTQEEMALYEEMIDKIVSQYNKVEVAPEDKGQYLFINNLGLIAINADKAAGQF